MNNISRRDFGRVALGTMGGLALAGMPTLEAAKAASSVFGGVQIGVQTYSFRDRPLEKALDDIVRIGISSVELFEGHLDPRKSSAEEIHKWKSRLAEAGVTVGGFYVSFADGITDEQIDSGFRGAKALGVNLVTTSVSKSMVPRLDKVCQRFKMKLGLHNHWFRGSRPDQFESPDDFLEALRTSSKWVNIALDVGHFYAAGHDPVKFIEEHRACIVLLHLKDRGDDPEHTDRPFGQGATPLAPVMQLLKKLRFEYPANIEWEVKDVDPATGVADALAYLKKVLA